MPQNIVFFTSYTPLWGVHYDTELELIQNHIDLGDHVTQLFCDGELAACDANTGHFLESCYQCQTRRTNGVKRIEGKLNQQNLLNLTAADKKNIAALPQAFETIKKLQDLYIQNFDIGYAAASSVVTATRNPNTDLQKYQKLTQRYLTSAAATFFSLKNYLNQHPTDIVYVFNGRFAHQRAVLRACQQLGVSCYIHERGQTKNHYNLTKNALPHEFSYIKNKMWQLWNEENPETRLKIGAQYFTDRAKGVEQHWKSFTVSQKKDLLPPQWNVNKRNIVLFCSSEDEYVSLGKEYDYPFYTDQLSGIKQIVESIKSDQNTHLYVRIHPNMIDFATEIVAAYHQILQHNVTIIASDSPVSSYALMHQASIVLCFGSIMGLEATFWGKPSVLLGSMTYGGLNAVYEPTSHQALMELIYTPNLEPKPAESVLVFGYYMYNFGTPFKFFVGETVTEGTFKGKKITDGSEKWAFKTIKNILNTTLFNRSLSLVLGYVSAQKLVKKYTN